MNTREPEAARSLPPLWSVAVLGVLVVANFYLRHTLEDAPHRMYSFLEYFYKAQVPIIFGQLPWWRLLLPIRELTGSWCATTLILTYLLERVLGSGGVWELYNAVAILVAFGTSWVVFRSAVFSLTLATCIGFGTQFYHAYAVTGGIASYALVTYHMLLLMAFVQIVRAARPLWLWRAAFVVSVLLNVLAYEGWLDVLVLMWVACPFVFILLQRQERRAEAWRLVRMVVVMTVVGAVYVFLKVKLGYGQAQGSESDVVFNYHSFWPILDDVVGNVFTHTYMSVSNFLPPVLVGASAFYRLGAEYLVKSQYRYHEPFTYLAVMNQVFFWRYYAGIVLAAVLYALYATTIRAWRRPSAWTMSVGVFLIMLLVGGPTHTFVKYRPMNSEPVMTYHVTVGVLGMSLLLAWLLTTAWRRVRNRRLAAAIVGLGWAAILSSAFTRPPYLSHMAAQAGLGEGLYPDPWQTLMTRFHLQYHAPRGGALYRLVPYDPYAESTRTRELLKDLPLALPPPEQWIVVSPTGKILEKRAGMVEMVGDASQAGYQLMTPPVLLRKDTRYIVRAKFAASEGQVCAGVLTGDQRRFLAPPDVFSPESSFESGDVTAVRVVLANCNPQVNGNPRSHIRLLGGTYGAIATEP